MYINIIENQYIIYYLITFLSKSYCTVWNII